MIATVMLVTAAVQLNANDKVIQLNQLPATAQDFIKDNFASEKISVIKQEYEITGRTYKVVFADGKSVEFDKKGIWNEIDYNKHSVPYSLVPNKINEYIKANYSGQRVVKIERENNKWEVKLQNGIELKFDSLFNIKSIDN